MNLISIFKYNYYDDFRKLLFIVMSYLALLFLQRIKFKML